MVDYFAVLDVPRRPWLEEEVVRENFHRRAATLHPDVAGGSEPAFTELNRAWQELRAPASRLRHFLELEHPASLEASRQTPAELTDLFLQIAELRQAAGAHAERRASASSPLARALLEPARLSLSKQVAALAHEAEARTAEVHALMKTGTTDPGHLAPALAKLVFLEKWQAQLRETATGLG